jgi:hypothetical protein
MDSRHIQPMRRAGGRLVVVVLACASVACASATLLLEEPFGTLGFFTATGHAAIYLSGVCAETPLVLRPCAPGESGIVLSRYDGVGGYDWVAIPLIPYLYAVERPEDVPLFADARMAAFLRDRYRRKYLEDIAPDAKDGETPGGNWYELVGSSYDRTMYGFEIETTPQQDEALIRKLNSSPNQSHFRLVSNNCADFAKDVFNFYYPKSLHRSIIADIGMTTPKQMATMLTRFSARHPELQFSRLILNSSSRASSSRKCQAACPAVRQCMEWSNLFSSRRSTSCPAPWSAPSLRDVWPQFTWARARATSNPRATPRSSSWAAPPSSLWAQKTAGPISNS